MAYKSILRPVPLLTAPAFVPAAVTYHVPGFSNNMQAVNGSGAGSRGAALDACSPETTF